VNVSNTQVDRLGDRLRSNEFSDADLQLLNDYRLSFAHAYQAVVGALRNTLKLESTGRPAKSTTSIIDKLRRESLRLKQIQDIAGCRVIVNDVGEQEGAVVLLTSAFPETLVVDRRQTPSHGYRAIHVIVRQAGRPVEVQIRTELEHSWAQLSEKLSDVIDPGVKYGGGPELLRSTLSGLSDLLGDMEILERRLLTEQVRPEDQESIALVMMQSAENKQQFRALIKRMIEQSHLWEDV
jgi:ppGpp synthetase/RelA/SpoT-type nucleotidyltranferase